MNLISSKLIKTIMAIFILIFSLQTIVFAQTQSYNITKSWEVLSPVPGDGARLFFPGNMVVDKYGYLYVADWGNNLIEKYDNNGKFVNKWTMTSWGTLAIGSSDNIFALRGDQYFIERFDREGNKLLSMDIGGSYPNSVHPYYLAVDKSDYVYVIDDGTDYIIKKFDIYGNLIKSWGTKGNEDSQFTFPSGIVVDSSYNIYIMDYNNNCIKKFDYDGHFIKKWGSPGTNDNQFTKPSLIFIDSLDKIYVVDQDNRIQVFNTEGEFKGKYISSINENSTYTPIIGVAVDPSGTLFIEKGIAESKSAEPLYQRFTGVQIEKLVPVQLPGLDHFNFDTIGNPKNKGEVFTVRITAIKQDGSAYTNFNGEGNLTDVKDLNQKVTFTDGICDAPVTINSEISNEQLTISAGEKSGKSNQFNVQSANPIPTLYVIVGVIVGIIVVVASVGYAKFAKKKGNAPALVRYPRSS